MKKSMVVLFGILAFALTQCASVNQTVCTAEQGLTQDTASVLSTQLECDHPDAVLASMTAVANKIHMCSPAPQGSLGNLMCTELATAAADAGITKVIPAEWGCKATNATNVVNNVIAAQCQKYFPAAKKH